MPRVSKKQNEIDIKNVINALLRDPNASVDSIGTVCQLSQQQVYRVLRILEEDKIVFGNPMLIDLSKLGKKRFIIMAKRSYGSPNDNTLKSASYSAQFLEGLAKDRIDIIPEDDYTCSGEFDMVTVIIADSILQANKYVEYLRNVSAGYFSSFSIVEVLFTTRKNMRMTPEVSQFTDYVTEVASLR